MKKYATYIKVGLVLLLLIFIVIDVGSDPISKEPIEKVRDEINKVSGFAEEPAAADRMLKRFYGLEPGDYEGVVLYISQDNMSVEEMLLVKLKDVSQGDAVKAAVEERVLDQLDRFEGYGAEQVSMLNAHVLNVKGNYIFFMVGDNAQEAQKAFLKSI